MIFDDHDDDAIYVYKKKMLNIFYSQTLSDILKTKICTCRINRIFYLKKIKEKAYHLEDDGRTLIANIQFILKNIMYFL